MALYGYGLLVGKVKAYRPQRHGSPHALIMVQPNVEGHPPYRVAVNLGSAQPGTQSEIEYQIVDIDAHGTPEARQLAERLRNIGATDNFLLTDGHPELPCLDFVRGGLLDLQQFTDVPSGEDPFRSEFEKALNEALKADQDAGALVAVFGTGYPCDHRAKIVPGTGFEGIDNIHMNQGAMHYVNGTQHYLENGPNQDGALIFLLPSGAKGFFVKFSTQTLQTDESGNPAVTRIDKIDSTPAAVRSAILTRPAAAAHFAALPRQAADIPRYIFADTNPNDETSQYIPDDDNGTFKTPFVMAFSLGHTRGPVPTPRAYPTMALSDIVGNNPPGYVNQADSERIVFDLAGDSGAPSQKKLPGEDSVTDMMSRNAQRLQPAFLFHVGDVVYFYGEQNYYYSQFSEPFRAYPAPIFAIPGNHDGIIYNDTMTSLDAFQKAFCATQPARWEGFGGILRSTMTQPGVYFTLDAPLVSIIGLYSNCSESLGWLDEPQLLFLYHELVRLKAERAANGRAVILAIHHCPRWFPGEKENADPTSAAIDRACEQAQFWPDAVVCGHAHLMQRIVRQTADRDTPYIICGSSGYGISPGQELAKDYMQQIMKDGDKLGTVILEEGYTRVTVDKPSNGGHPTLSFEYFSVKRADDTPADSCKVDLVTHRLL
ncbi:DUF2278 family protein [Trinickia acidisoli]|uniref:DUF2278 family protein n=1 Tax=Trinickia acidisoli TaxID=2767482 RepID=UPI001A8E3E4D|nr:DUF2278 family protein [Trinickia acidisoli]